MDTKNILTKSTRTKANIVGVWMFSILAVIGLILIGYGLMLTISDVSSELGGAQGLVAIIVGFWMYIIIPITFIMLFFAFIFFVNFGMPKSTTDLSRDYIALYYRKAKRTGLLILIISSVVLLLVLWFGLRSLSVLSGGYVFFIGAVFVGLIPFTIMSIGWSLIILTRARTAKRLLMRRS